MVDVAQLVRAADCGSVGRGFESHLPPKKQQSLLVVAFFISISFLSFVLKFNNQINLYAYVFRNS